MPKVNVNGTVLHYEAHGEGYPLIFVHGFGCTLDIWRNQVEAFSRSHRFITFDLPGHGKSAAPSSPDEYSSDAVVADIFQLMDILGIQKAVIGGHSMGAYIAMRCQATHPERISGLIVIGGGPGFHTAKARDAWNRVWVDYAEVLEKEGLQAFAAKFPWLVRGTGHNPVGLASAASIMIRQDDSRVIEGLARIRVPTLVLIGERDKYNFRPAQYIAKAVPHARYVVIPGAGHAASEDNPEGFNAAVLDFLKDNSEAIVCGTKP